MKKTLLSFLLFSLVIVGYSQVTRDKNLVNKLAESKACRHEMMQTLKQSKLGDSYDLYYHRMNWTVNPAVNYIQGNVASYFTAKSAMNTIQFELNNSLTVDSVKYHSQKITFTHNSGIITANFPGTILSNTKDSLTVFYHGAPTSSGFGSFITTTHGNNTPVLWTLSEPYGASEWWPCKNSLSDKIDSIDVFITTPQAYKAASNGMLKSTTTHSGNKTFHWKHKYPIATYLIAIAVTDYQIFSNFVTLNSGTLEILNYAYPEDFASAQIDAPALLPVMQLYDSLFFDYPYMNERYGHAQFSWGGGMEHQTMTFLANFGYDLMSHELAHQWFGDKVTCKSWADIWINEGFATYLNGIIYDFLHSPTDFNDWKKDAIQFITSQPDGSVYCTDTTNVWRIFDSRLSYNKGAMVLHMLRQNIGDSAFFTGLKNFMTDPQLAYGFAGTTQFKTHVETTSGTNLTEFFNDWIYGQGHPVYTINTIIHNDSTVTVTINQAPSHNSVSFFELGVPLKFSLGSKDTIIVFNNTSNNQIFHATLDFRPNHIVFDPNWDICAVANPIITNTSHAEIDELLKISPNPVNHSLFINWGTISASKIIITDINGSIIKSFIINPEIGNYQISMQDLAQGTYFIKVISSDNILVRKIVKQ